MDEKQEVTPELHEKGLERAQLLLDEIISFFRTDPFLTNPELLALIHEMRSALDIAEKELLSSPYRPFHVDGHEERMQAMHEELAEKYGSPST